MSSITHIKLWNIRGWSSVIYAGLELPLNSNLWVASVSSLLNTRMVTSPCVHCAKDGYHQIARPGRCQALHSPMGPHALVHRWLFLGVAWVFSFELMGVESVKLCKLQTNCKYQFVCNLHNFTDSTPINSKEKTQATPRKSHLWTSAWGPMGLWRAWQRPGRAIWW
jgi:hypothetical protein